MTIHFVSKSAPRRSPFNRTEVYSNYVFFVETRADRMLFDLELKRPTNGGVLRFEDTKISGIYHVETDYDGRNDDYPESSEDSCRITLFCRYTHLGLLPGEGEDPEPSQGETE